MPHYQEFVALVQSWLAITLAVGIVVTLLHFVNSNARRPFPTQRRRAVPWTGQLVTAAFLMLLFVPALVVSFIDRSAYAHFWGIDPDSLQMRGLLVVTASLLAMPLQLAAWYGLLTSTGAPLTLSPRRAGAAVVAAFRTWLVLTPAVYAVNVVVLVVYGLTVGKQPDEHPIMQMVQSGSLPVGILVLLIAEALLAAPVREELFFRGILQPWLAERPWGGDLSLGLAAVAGVVFLQDAPTVLSRLTPILFVLALLPLYRFVDSWPVLARWLPVRDAQAQRQAMRAIFGSAALFASFHSSVWPTPIPLFVLALGLGWLAYRTQSVVAPIVLHVMFNAIVFGALFLQNR